MRAAPLALYLITYLVFNSVSVAQNLRLELVSDQIVRPAVAASTPADPTALYVGEHHSGRIMRIDLCTGELTIFFVVPNVVTSYSKGLVGLAFHPDYQNNGRFYVSYLTAPVNAGTDSVSRIREYTVDPNGVIGRPRDIMTWEQPNHQHNNAFCIFGPDGMLYIGSGDGGPQYGGFPRLNYSQRLDTLFGKILRIDVDHQDAGLPYHIPDGAYGEQPNPYVGATDSFGNTARGEIWLYGLRMPWRGTFDRATGDFYLGDVGQHVYEWVNFAPSGTGGRNYGWCQFEGGSDHPTDDLFNMEHCILDTTTDLSEPIYVYQHQDPDGELNDWNTVIGGYVYRGSAIPQLQGCYVFGDNAAGNVFSFGYNQIDGITDFVDHSDALRTPDLSSFAEDESGELYLLGYTSGVVHRLIEDRPRDLLVNDRMDYQGFATFASYWQSQLLGLPADQDGDCKVGISDLLLLLSAWLNGSP